jgi:iron complex transport system ATP-binding protein
MVLDGISLDLSDGEIGVVLGRNGSGKTTLFKNIIGIESPTSGSITFDGVDLSTISRRERAQKIAYVPQDIRFGSLTVYDTVLMGRVSYFGFKSGKHDQDVVDEILCEMGLESFAARNVQELSGGERQKIAIARALAQEPRMMIFDEPTGNLDIANEQLIVEEAKRVARERSISILTSVHDLNLAMELGDKFYFMKGGKIVYSGRDEIFTVENISDIFDAQIRIVDIDGKKVIINSKGDK